MHDDYTAPELPPTPGRLADPHGAGGQPWPSVGNSADPCGECGHTSCRCEGGEELPAQFVAEFAWVRPRSFNTIAGYPVNLPNSLLSLYHSGHIESNEGERWFSLPSSPDFRNDGGAPMVQWERPKGYGASRGCWSRFPLPWIAHAFADPSEVMQTWSLYRWTRAGRFAWLSDAGRGQARAALLCVLLAALAWLLTRFQR